MPLSRAIAAVLATAAAFCALGLERPAFALESECSACEVVAAALSSRIAAEGAKTVLDMRGRLGPQAGQRQGKRIDWRSSETRLAALLEGLCAADALDADFAVRKKEKPVGLSVVDADDGGDDDDDDDDDEDEDEEESREVLWLRRGDAGKEKEKGFTRVTEEREKDYRSKQLQGWCGRLVSEVEEGLALELASAAAVPSSSANEDESRRESGEGKDAPPFDARAALCERLTRSCAPAKKEEPASGTAPASAKEQKRSWRGKRNKQQREEL